MTTPFKALNPFTPRFVEIDYVAPDGGCCALSSSSGSQQSLPDDDPPDPPVPDPEFVVEAFINEEWTPLSQVEPNGFGPIGSPADFDMRLRNTGEVELSSVSFALSNISALSVQSEQSASPFTVAIGGTWEFTIHDDNSGSSGDGSLLFTGGITAAYELFIAHIIS